MKYLLIDKALLLITVFLMVLFLPIQFGPVTTIILKWLMVILAFFFCKSLLLFPIDLFFGVKEEKGLFIDCLSVKRYEFFRKKGFCVLLFDIDSQGLCLIVPLTCLVSEITEEAFPPKETPLIIKYYRFTKVLCSWKEVIQ